VARRPPPAARRSPGLSCRSLTLSDPVESRRSGVASTWTLVERLTASACGSTHVGRLPSSAAREALGASGSRLLPARRPPTRFPPRIRAWARRPRRACGADPRPRPTTQPGDSVTVARDGVSGGWSRVDPRDGVTHAECLDFAQDSRRVPLERIRTSRIRPGASLDRRGSSRPGSSQVSARLVSGSTRCAEYLSTIRDVSSHRHPTGRPAAFPDGYGLRTGTDGPDRLRRPSRPPEFQGGPNAREHGSCHVRHHLLMGTADANRCDSM
jgi:hypothetical protein